jgi:isoleucyl-tRNA synthetase
MENTDNGKKYKDTLNLPKTDFPMKGDLPKREPETLRAWQEERLYWKIQEKNKSSEWYLLHDGPPYANGAIHIGHCLNKVLKDFVVKYKSMKGFKSPFVPGWDCHGLPVEHQLLKELHKTKDDVQQVAFRKQAAEFANRWVKVQSNEFQRLGVFGDWDKPYLTMDKEYEAREIESFGKMFHDGYIYSGQRPIHWCFTCETALAEAEVEYADKASPSIFVAFPVDSGINKLFKTANASIVIWTTTPWTIPANLAIALGEKIDYAAVKADSRVLIVAEATLERLKNELKWQDVEIIGKVKGKELEGKSARHPFIYRESKIILSEYIDLEVGTGCVHTAPGHGYEDYIIGKKYGLDVYSPVNERGQFTSEVKEFEHQNVFKANAPIIELLAEKHSLIGKSEIKHSYPHCWRCKKPVIFRATKQWFLDVDHNGLRKRTLEEIGKVTWIPDYGANRIGAMVGNRPDWCLSRQRLWGVPIPIFHCEKCENAFCTDETISFLAGLVKNFGVDIWFEKNSAELVPKGTKCPKCGGTEFRKETDILDVWFDSGTSHQSVLEIRDELKYPCDLYLEGSDQHRGWFQTSILTSMALENKAPFKTVLTHGWTLDEKGEKESKSKGNITPPQLIFKEWGADILRLWVSSVDYRSDVMIGAKIVGQMADTYRKIRNTLRFMLANVYDFNIKSDALPYSELGEMHRYILSRTCAVMEEVTDAYEKFEFYRVYRLLYNFCTIDLSSLYLDILKDVLYTWGADSRERRSSQTVFSEVLRILNLVIAPILPYTAEETWKFLPCYDGRSIHLQDYPDIPAAQRDTNLEERWKRLLAIRSVVMKKLEEKREKREIGNSLEGAVFIQTSDRELFDFLSSFTDNLGTIFIVSHAEIKFTDKIEEPISDEEGLSKLSVTISKARGTKCARCWKYRESVGRSAEHSAICSDCVDVVNKFDF